MERGFLRKHAKTVLRDWKVALIELVSNAWDAGSTRLRIILPKTPNDFLTMEDNGIGLSKIEFEERWPKLYYDRVEHQGTKVQFPDGLNLNRMAHGKRGLGRHACFFFDSQYFVQASKNGGLCLFSVKENDVTFDIQMLKESVIAPPNHGLKICFKLKTILSLTPKSVTDLIGSKFLADPNFEIFVNGEKINPFDFQKKEKYEIPTKYGLITIYFFDTQYRGRSSKLNGIAWWVNSKQVGEFAWKYFPGGNRIDARFKAGWLYTFIVIADILANDVKEDWSEFEKNERTECVFQEVEKVIIKKLQELSAETRFEQKKRLLQKYVREIKQLPVLSRDCISTFINEIQINCPRLEDGDLSNILKILINLESAKTGYTILSQLAKSTSEDFDNLSEILEKFTIEEAKHIINELHRRLKIIEDLEEFTHKKSDELHQLQPIFERALWIFGPEYDGVQFTSNRQMTTVIKTFFSKNVKYLVKDRPDFVALDNSSIGVYSASDFTDESGILNYSKILIVELKKGTSEIKFEELNQALEYARILIQKVSIPKSTKIECYVLGSTIAQGMDKISQGEYLKAYPTTYTRVIETAKKRTFDLYDKINHIAKDQDTEMKDILAQKEMDEYITGTEIKEGKQ